VKKPKLTDGAPKGFVGNHHLWFIKEYRKWKESKQRVQNLDYPFRIKDTFIPPKNNL